MSAKRPFINLTFYETYFFANAVKNILEDQFSYLRHLDEFYGDNRYLANAVPFPKFSAFHSFIYFIIDDLLNDDVTNIDLEKRQEDVKRFKTIPSALDLHPSKLPVNLAFDRFGIAHESFDTWLEIRNRTFLEASNDDVSDYYDDLRLEGPLEELLERATSEVFFVLFQNRRVLMLFNDMMSRQMNEAVEIELIDPEYARFFVRPGVLRRVSIPSWARRAVYFRDRGLCVLCHKDLSGVLAVGGEENYDHIVPLAAGGLNDVTNIQLLCKECNAKKLAGEPITSSHYQRWYLELE
jgi:hypothetical protein